MALDDREPQSLLALIPAGMFVGTSLILRQGGRFLYGVRPPHAEGRRQIIELTGIGGGMEEEDESLTAGVLREAQEEMGCGVQLLSCRQTAIVRGPDRVEWATLPGAERPAAVVFRRFGRPHEPWHPANRGEACLVVFWAELEEQPQPAMELPALIWLTPTQVVETARRDVLLTQLLASGATLLERTLEPMPRAAWARLTDSQEALVLALGDNALPFYQALADRC